ncbi:anhydro-N-acetylmuramic acid kinase, partial [Novosphingobium huizhouense]|uniref:anhydro-N-acetylmuramic acid kinase n=1 Tax=Novosphingobium huizhouense TaxID=2866625 RepID=UPI001CD8AB5A
MAFDTGPANAPINDLMRARLRQSHDRDGALAAAGQVHEEVLRDFLTHPYFDRPPPKSLDRDQFAGLSSAVESLGDADAAATLVAAL